MREQDMTTQLEREASYGRSAFNQTCLAKSWTAVLESHYQTSLPHDIPPHVAVEMLVALKTLRAAMPGEFRADDFIDGRVYLNIAQDLKAKGQDK